MRLSKSSQLALSSLMAAVALTACGGGGDSNSSNPPAPVSLPQPPAPGPAPAPSYSIGGEVSGLAGGKTLQLRNSAGEDLTVSHNGGFQFNKKLPPKTNYAVSVASQPVGQLCSIHHGSGTATADVADIKVQCSDDTVVPAYSSTECFSNEALWRKGNSWTIVGSDETRKYTVLGETDYFNQTATAILVQTQKAGANNVEETRFEGIDKGMYLVHGRKTNDAPGITNRYSPPLAHPISMGPNESHTFETESFTDILGRTFSSKYVETATYLGRATTTTAFGIFGTCKMRYSSVGDSGVTHEKYVWRIASGKLAGLVAQELTETGVVQQPENLTVSWD